ncbi:hypothetical protein EB796_014187 [Bugula neritina]|uniref:Large ribosomal subunit protein uL14m n=1 Tax=Bugula neritina TaxID=10212 RepID=A0A7J7JPB3_BUGNE|nr:hypothetical protein EB796_014187 [Bugula neritina]
MQNFLGFSRQSVFGCLVHSRLISTTSHNLQIQLRTRLKVVDNSLLGKEAVERGRPAYCIHVYQKSRVGTTGDIIRVAIRGQPKKAVLVGCKQRQRHGVPRQSCLLTAFLGAVSLLLCWRDVNWPYISTWLTSISIFITDLPL